MDINDQKVLDLFHKVGELKSIRRAGWFRAGVSESKVESVADHTFRTGFLSMVLGDILKLNTEKLMKMAIIHDLAEVITGDITPFDEIPLTEKREKESLAIQNLFSEIQNNDEYLALWHEFDAQTSDEAKLIKNIDKLEMALSASEYQTEFKDKDLGEFLVDAEKYINIEEVRRLLDKIKAEME